MARMRPAPRIGLSTYMVCMAGKSNQVSHMSRTITSSSGSSGFFARAFSSCSACLLRTRRTSSGPSAADPVMITFTVPLSSSSLCHCGRSAMMAS
jgi:hypothetical protein